MSYTESETRQQKIDQQLAKAGWGVQQRVAKIIEELHLPSIAKVQEAAVDYQSGSRYVDYALLGRDQRPIAIVEAKRSSRDPLEGEPQAIEYAKRLKETQKILPFIFLANGDQIWFLDYGRYPVRQVSGFFSRQDLERLAYQRQYSRPLDELEVNLKIVDRLYQIEAAKRVAKAVGEGHRRFLLVMATGTGKTRTAIALIDLLLRAKRVQRVLFLADRRELVRQALGAFKEHLPYESRARVEGGQADSTVRIHVATYPSMIQVYKQLSPGYYDLIIADESHRSIYNRYKKLFEHFDALFLGLTATPTDYIEHNTFQLFNCIDGNPTFEYGYEEAVQGEYLADYRVLESKTRFQIEGIKAGKLPPEFRRQLEEQNIELSEINFEGSDLERRVTNTGTNDVMVREFMENCRKDVSGTLPAKTIIFAMSHAHALELYKSFNRLYPASQRRGMAKVIDSHMERTDKLIDDFKFQDMPRVAISVDMLDTGIDVPAIQNLVFAKPVFSQVKFWQMIGRGTRLWTDPQSGQEKRDFLILDFWGNFAYFQMNPEGETTSVATPLPVRLFRLRLEKLSWLQSAGDLQAIEATREQLQTMLAELPSEDLNVRPHLYELDALQTDAAWNDLSPERRKHLNQAIAPLLRLLPNVNLPVMTFEVRTEQLALAYLKGDTFTIEKLRGEMEDDLSALPTDLPEVSVHVEIIAWVKSDGFWEHLDYSRVMIVQKQLAPLMQYRRSQSQQIIHLSLPDKIASRLWIAYGPAGEGAFVQSYRQQVEAYIRDLATQHPVLLKLQYGQSLNEDDAETLADMLNHPDLFITEDTLRQAYEQPNAMLVDFLLHILKLSDLPSREEKIKAAFADFIAAHPHFRTSQLQFVRLVRTAVLRRARLTTEDLTLPPFTRAGRVEQLFTSLELDEMLELASLFAIPVE